MPGRALSGLSALLGEPEDTSESPADQRPARGARAKRGGRALSGLNALLGEPGDSDSDGEAAADEQLQATASAVHAAAGAVYTVTRTCMVRAGADMGSDKVGLLEVGAAFTALEVRTGDDGRERVRLDQGWLTADGPTGIFARAATSRRAESSGRAMPDALAAAPEPKAQGLEAAVKALVESPRSTADAAMKSAMRRRRQRLVEGRRLAEAEHKRKSIDFESQPAPTRPMATSARMAYARVSLHYGDRGGGEAEQEVRNWRIVARRMGVSVASCYGYDPRQGALHYALSHAADAAEAHAVAAELLDNGAAGHALGHRRGSGLAWRSESALHVAIRAHRSPQLVRLLCTARRPADMTFESVDVCRSVKKTRRSEQKVLRLRCQHKKAVSRASFAQSSVHNVIVRYWDARI